jgi:hypothetical protein
VKPPESDDPVVRESDRRDRLAALQTNIRFADAGPVGTLSTATTVQLTHVAGVPCECSCASHCEACGPEDAA